MCHHCSMFYVLRDVGFTALPCYDPALRVDVNGKSPPARFSTHVMAVHNDGSIYVQSGAEVRRIKDGIVETVAASVNFADKEQPDTKFAHISGQIELALARGFMSAS